MSKIPLKELCIKDEIGKYGIPASAENFDENKIRYLRITDIDDYGNLLNNDKKSVSSDDIEKYILEEGDIVFARTGNSTGRTYYHENKNGNLAFAGFLIKYSLDKEKVNPKYVKYFTLSQEYKQWVKNISVGSTRGNINAQTFADCPVIVPSRLQQDDLVKILSALDDKIELNNRINAELEAMAKTLYDYWFVQFDFPNEEAKPYKSSGGKMVYNETLKREIPEGWEVKTVGELVNIFDSKRIPLSKSEREKKKGIFPYYGATEIMDYINDFIFDGEYILLAEDGSVMNSEGFPILQYIYGKTWVNNHAHVLQSKQIEYTEYLYKLLEMIPVILIKSGSIQMKINQDNLLNYKLLVAPETLILKYSKFAKSIRQKLIQNQKQNQELSALRDWLLPMLMNGQVKVGEIIL